MKYCTKFILNNCTNEGCKFKHDNDVCVFFLKDRCKYGDKCNKKHPEDAEKITKSNTTTLVPSHLPTELKLVYRLDREVKPNEVNIIPAFFNREISSSLFTELDKSSLIRWHEDTHSIMNDKLDWKKLSPTFNIIVHTIAQYFKMKVSMTRLNYFKTTLDWKPYHQDASAFKPNFALNQNFKVSVMFGATREVSFYELKSGTTVSFDMLDGCLYVHKKDINNAWKNGILQEKDERDESTINIVVWGNIEA